MKSKLSIEQMVVALFRLCSDVVLLKSRDGNFYYFKPCTQENIPAIQYILRQNGATSYRHFSRYYNTGYGDKNLVVRMPKSNFEHNANPEFISRFEKMYSERNVVMSASGVMGPTVGKMFWIKTKSYKANILADIAKYLR